MTYIHNTYQTHYTRVATRISRGLMNTALVDLLNHTDDDADTELGVCFFPGSDDKLGFEKVELEGYECMGITTTIS